MICSSLVKRNQYYVEARPETETRAAVWAGAADVFESILGVRRRGRIGLGISRAVAGSFVTLTAGEARWVIRGRPATRNQGRPTKPACMQLISWYSFCVAFPWETRPRSYQKSTVVTCDTPSGKVSSAGIRSADTDRFVELAVRSPSVRLGARIDRYTSGDGTDSCWSFRERGS